MRANEGESERRGEREREQSGGRARARANESLRAGERAEKNEFPPSLAKVREGRTERKEREGRRVRRRPYHLFEFMGEGLQTALRSANGICGSATARKGGLSAGMQPVSTAIHSYIYISYNIQHCVLIYYIIYRCGRGADVGRTLGLLLCNNISYKI